MTTAVMYPRELAYIYPISPPFTMTPNKYSKSAIGGPLDASVSVRGTPNALLSLGNYLRHPVSFFDKRKEATWWGYAHNMEIRFGQRKVNVSVGSMWNRCRVTYSKLQPGQETSSLQEVTEWAEDPESVGLYGIKEKTDRASNTLPEVAEAIRDSLLYNNRLPVLAPRTGQSEGGSYSALMDCRGWFSTLGWQHYYQAAGMEGYTDTGDGTTQLGFGKTGVVSVAQSFATPASISWYADTLSIRARKFGSPIDSMLLEVCADSGGAPGAVLATATIAAGVFTDSYQWVYGTVAARYLIAPSTTYWLRASRTGGISDDDYYGLDINVELGYTRGVFRLWNGSAWVARDPDADMLFKVGGVLETSQQITDMVTAKGQFIVKTSVTPNSGVYSSPFRDGYNTTLYYLRDLIRTGAEQGRRYLIRTTPYREIEVYLEPTAIALQVDENDNWWRGATPVIKSECPVGEWYEMVNLPPTLTGIGLIDPDKYFIASSEYIVAKNLLRTEPGEPSWEVLTSQ